MALKTMIENLNKAREAYEAQVKSLGADAQKAIAEALGDLIPEGKVLYWSQYTPYFNDGEPCEFSVNIPSLDDEGTTDEDDRSYKSLPPDLRTAWDALPEDMMLAAFGDHREVSVRRGGAFEVSDYEHD